MAATERPTYSQTHDTRRAGELVAAATIAKNNGECVKVKFSGTPATPVYLGAYTYRGGYCT